MQANSVQAVLFDLDGTLIDTAADFMGCLSRLAVELALPMVSETAVRQTVSSGARALLQLLTGLDDQTPGFEQKLERLLALYAEQIRRSQATLYPGMPGLLCRLQDEGTPWGIVTNKPEQYSVVLLEQLGLDENCSVLICPDHVTHRKPHPEPLLLASSRLGLAPAHCIYAGDHPRDITAGREAGMFCVAAAYGYLPPEPDISEWDADLIVHSAAELDRWLLDRPGSTISSQTNDRTTL